MSRLVSRSYVNRLFEVGIHLKNVFTLKDGRVHTSAETMSFLREFFDSRLISPRLWSPQSPDLTPQHTFLRDYLKDRVFARGSTTIEKLKQHITNEINAIPYAVLPRVFGNILKRFRLCKREQDGHIQHLS